MKTESIVNGMACIATATGVPHYLGDLVHDGFNVAKAKPGDTLYWMFKRNECGTWLGDKTFIRHCMNEGFKKLYKITIVEIHENGLPMGTLEQVESV